MPGRHSIATWLGEGLCTVARIGCLVGGALLGGVLVLLRLPTARWDTLYAEDGFVFLDSWMNAPGRGGGVLAVLVEPYAGYQHLLPRLASLAVSVLPVPWWGIASTAVACLAVGAVAALSYLAAGEAVSSRAARAAVAACPLLLPLAGVEAVGNLANLHWYLSYLLFWMLWLRRDRTPAAWAGWCVVGFVAAATEIQSVLLAPAIGWRLWRTPAARPVWVAWGCGIAWQAASYLTCGRPRSTSGLDGDALALGYVVNVLLGGVDAVRGDYAVFAGGSGGSGGSGTLRLAVASVVAVAWLVTLIRLPRAGALVRAPVATAALASVAFWVLAAGYNAGLGVPAWTLFRWGTSASLLAWCTVPFVLDALAPGRRRLLLAAACLVWVVGFPATVPDRLAGPTWSSSVAAAAARCAVTDGRGAVADGRSAVEDGRGAVEVPQTPANWIVAVPCARLR